MQVGEVFYFINTLVYVQLLNLKSYFTVKSLNNTHGYFLFALILFFKKRMKKQKHLKHFFLI